MTTLAAPKAPVFTYREDTHQYFLDGVEIPGVSDVLEAAGLKHGWSGFQEAQLRGQHVHECCELDDLHDLDETSVYPAYRGYLEAWRAFKRDTDFVPTLIEYQTYRHDLRFAGTLDRVGTVKGTRTLCDLKTGSVEASHALQVAGYAILLNEPTIDRLLVYLREDGHYALQPCRDPSDLRVFLAAVTICHAQRAMRNGRTA